MSQLLELSAGILDGTTDPDGTGPVNRINFQLSSITDRVALVEAFSHCVLFETDDGLLGFDTSSVQGGERVVSAIRNWRQAPFHTLVYTPWPSGSRWGLRRLYGERKSTRSCQADTRRS